MLEDVAEALFAYAVEQLEASGEFRPFGVAVTRAGEIQFFEISSDGDFRVKSEELKAELRRIGESGEAAAVAYCRDVVLHGENQTKQDAMQCQVEGIDGRVLSLYRPYSIDELGVVECREDIAGEARRELVGFTRCLLRVEGKADVSSPLASELLDAVDSITPAGGPGFLILETGEEDIAQVAGGQGHYTVEWREGDRHWVAGHVGEESGPNVAVQTNGCVVIVRANEVLSCNEAKSLLMQFAEGQARPVEYSWRDRAAGDLGSAR